MANFSGHLYGGAIISSFAALTVYSIGWTGPQQTQWLFLLGVTGGLLPDIDSDNSTPVRGFFTLLGIVLAFWVSFAFVGRFPVLNLMLIWSAVFVVVRYGVFEVFARFTVHRGIWHSWLGVVFAGVATADAAHYFAGMNAFDSWLAGFFVALGYLTHLLLDEMASVDLLGNRVRRSFGTAMKPFSMAYPRASIGMLAGVIALSVPAPALESVVAAGERYGFSADALQARVLGDGDWMTQLRGVLASDKSL